MLGVLQRLRVWFRRYFLGYGQYRYQRNGRYTYDRQQNRPMRGHRYGRLNDR
jgi:hypothetical protein